MNRTSLHAALVTVLAWCAYGQPPAFEVVSVKPNKSSANSSSMNSHEGVMTATNVSLQFFIMQAFKVRDYQISGPEWLDSERFDVSAKPPAGIKPEDLPLMLQAMLADRFKLTLHRETKMSSAYVLVVAKGGPKFKDVEDKGSRNSNSGRGKFEGKPTGMDGLAEFLSGEMDRPVVDMTELKGAYNIALRWTPDEVVQAKESKGDKESYPPLTMALQEQLGLKLEPKKAPIALLVIDHVEKVPTEN